MPRRLSATALRRAVPAATGALVCALFATVVGLAALVVQGTRAADASALQALLRLDGPHSSGALNAAVHSVDPVPFALASLVLVAVALVRGRVAVAVLLPVLLIGSGATTQALKRILGTPRLQEFLAGEHLGEATWPSGHSTAAMALALGLVLVVPRAIRPAAAVAGGALAVSVGVSLVAIGWHLPSDVIGGFLVAAIWALGVIAVLRVLDRDPAPAPAQRGAWAVALALLAGGAVVLVALAAMIAVTRPDAWAMLARPAAVAAVAGIAALAAAIPLGTSRAVGP